MARTDPRKTMRGMEITGFNEGNARLLNLMNNTVRMVAPVTTHIIVTPVTTWKSQIPSAIKSSNRASRILAAPLRQEASIMHTASRKRSSEYPNTVIVMNLSRRSKGFRLRSPMNIINACQLLLSTFTGEIPAPGGRRMRCLLRMKDGAFYGIRKVRMC